jgi:hypothetical protein
LAASEGLEASESVAALVFKLKELSSWAQNFELRFKVDGWEAVLSQGLKRRAIPHPFEHLKGKLLGSRWSPSKYALRGSLNLGPKSDKLKHFDLLCAKKLICKVKELGKVCHFFRRLSRLRLGIQKHYLDIKLQAGAAWKQKGLKLWGDQFLKVEVSRSSLSWCAMRSSWK